MGRRPLRIHRLIPLPLAPGGSLGIRLGRIRGLRSGGIVALGVVGSLLIAAEEAIEETPADHRVGAGARVDAARAPMERPSDG